MLLVPPGSELTVVRFSASVPVFVPVDAPDHSDADAQGSQQQRAQGQLPASDGEAGKADSK